VLTSDGIWLHHCLLTSLGRTSSITPFGRSVLSSGGNERPTLRLNTQHRYGIDWPRSFNINFELMSEIKRDVDVNIAITFEYIEKDQPIAKEYRDSYLKWNAVATPDLQRGPTTYKTKPWSVTRSGVLLHAMGHMHDGGTHIDLIINDRVACSSRMYYGTRPGYGGSTTDHSHPNQMNKPKTISNPQPNNNLQPNKNAQPNSNPPRPVNNPRPSTWIPTPRIVAEFSDSKIEREVLTLARRSELARRDGPSHIAFGGVHLSAPGHCTSFGRVQEGDKMYVVAHYNTTSNQQMTHNGQVEDNMGIIRVYIGPDED
jgi:hypothetical protein